MWLFYVGSIAIFFYVLFFSCAQCNEEVLQEEIDEKLHWVIGKELLKQLNQSLQHRKENNCDFTECDGN